MNNVLCEKRKQKIYLEDDGIFTTCVKCGKELQVDLADSTVDGRLDLYAVSWYCQKCGEEVRNKPTERI